MACARLFPHMSTEGCRPAQKAGRSGCPKIRQRLSSASCTQRTPAGLPLGMPGIGLVIEGAVQQAPQWSRQFIKCQGRAAVVEAAGANSISSGERKRTARPEHDRPRLWLAGAAQFAFLLRWTQQITRRRTLRMASSVSYTHLTLPTICSV